MVCAAGVGWGGVGGGSSWRGNEPEGKEGKHLNKFFLLSAPGPRETVFVCASCNQTLSK